MNTKIPFTKDIPFLKKVSEITSISLEHEIKVEDNILKGNFIISGDYKTHEVSVNKEPFSYMLPFEIELASDIDTETIEFMIDDFTYEIIDNTSLRVNIDFNILASKKEIVEEPKPIFEDASNLFAEEERDEIDEILDIKKDDEKKPEPEKEINSNIEEAEEVEEKMDNKKPEPEIEEIPVLEEIKETREEKPTIIEETKEEVKEILNEDTIIKNINAKDEAYATYHIHMVSDGETIETICTMYNSNLNILSEYNDLGEINSGDKLIIPEKNE